MSRAAGFVLSHYGEAGIDAIPLMIGALEEKRFNYTGQDMMEMLGNFGPLAEDALPLLKHIRKYDTFLDDREYAWEAIAKIEGTCEDGK